MKKYELTLLYKKDNKPCSEFIVEKVKGLGGRVLKIEDEGRKRLPFPIGDYEFAVYYFYEVELPPYTTEKVAELLDNTDEVLRYLIVREDPKWARKENYERESFI